MGFRKELKYIIHRCQFETLRTKLSIYLRQDVHGDAFGYQVKSLYFDSINNKDLFDVLNGNFIKGKVRLRTYGINSKVYNLELKQKTGNDVIKRVIELSETQAKEISTGEYRSLMTIDDPFAKSLYCKMKSEYYRPKIIITYRRQAFVHPINNIRVTYDSDVRSSIDTSRFFSDDIKGLIDTSPCMGILEVKYDDFIFEPVKRVLSEINQSQSANSKYANVIIKHSI